MDIVRPELKRKKRIKQLLWTGAAVAGLTIVAVALARLEPAAPTVERAAVWTDTVKRGEMLRQVRGPGTLVPKEVRWISATTEARVDRVLVKPGAAVEPGTRLVEMSNPELSQQVQEAKSQLVASEADNAALEVSLQDHVLDQKATLAQVKADYEGARLQVAAEEVLLKDGIIPKIQYQRSKLQAEQLGVRLDIEKQRSDQLKKSTDAQLRAAHARTEQLENMLTLRQQQLDGLTVTAGINGVLQELPVEEGQRVAPGQTIARVAQPQTLMAELRIAETQAKDVQLGQSVQVDTRNGIVPGKVVRIDPRVSNGTVQVDVDLTGELPDGARPDLTVDGTILIERLEDVLYVGRPAYGQPDSTVSLFKLDPARDTAVRVPVQLGRSSVNTIEVRKGLNAGDTVILSDTSAWDDYDRIRLD